MYRKDEQKIILAENFELSLEGKLAANNRWVILSELIPWTEFEEEYAKKFSVEEIGAPAKPFRMALGALIIKERLGVSDRETVEQIRENPYLQYFLGMSAYSNEAPFEASTLVHFRQRITIELVNKINRKMVSNAEESIEEETVKKKVLGEKSEETNRGRLILDATCVPADISYPTDLGILNQARKQTEKSIDILYDALENKTNKKPKTYRESARKDYLEVAKKRRPSKKQRQKSIKKQLQYIKRNLGHIAELARDTGLKPLNRQEYKMLLVTAEIYRQQLWMYENKSRRIDDRIVSLTQPHVRPIIRGKAGSSVEFGAKLSASCLRGYVFLDRLSWNNFNESGDLKMQVEAFKNYTGYYPESVHVDKIYRTKDNRDWCKARGIRISGIPLGRPPKNISKETKKQAQLDERVRNCIEGKFGEGKRRFSLNRVMAKLSNTSETAIAITFLVMNLSKLLRQFCRLFLCLFPNQTLPPLFLLY
jgi:transposase, IS5 family